VILTFAPEKAVFEFSQLLDNAYKETARTPPLAVKAQQQGFLFYESQLQGPRVMRLVTENLLSKTSMLTLKKTEQATRKEYFEEHLRLYFELPKPFGLELPLEVSSDLMGRGAMPTVDGQPTTPPLALPWEIVHFPLMTGVSAEDPAAGKEWKGVVKVKCGFGQFDLPFTGKWAAKDTTYATAEVSFDPPTGQEQPATFKSVKLQFKAEGKWKVKYRLADGCPMVGGGNVGYVGVATSPSGENVEVINAKVGFKWRFVPVGFTKKEMMTASWGMMEADYGV